jgi:hypothetical protein
MSAKQNLRPLDEIVRLHDAIESILCGEAPVELNEQEREALSGVRASLCWVLAHPGGMIVEEMKEDLDRLCAAVGFSLALLPEDDPRRLRSELKKKGLAALKIQWADSFRRALVFGTDFVRLSGQREDGVRIELLSSLLGFDETVDALDSLTQFLHKQREDHDAEEDC